MPDEMEKALEHDEARREQIRKNKERAIAAGTAPVMTQERAEKVAAAQRLRIELGSFASMPPDVRANPQVRGRLWPKVLEYSHLRMELAVNAVCDLLVSELRLTKAEIDEIFVRHDVTPSDGTPSAPIPRDAAMTPPGREPPILERMRGRLTALEGRVTQLEAWGEDLEKRLAKSFDTSDV